MKLSLNLHECNDSQISASAEVHDNVAWLTLNICDASFNVFMTPERAKRLAAAINAAEKVSVGMRTYPKETR